MSSFEPVLPWSPGPNWPHWNDLLRDGTRVVIRPIAKHGNAHDAARESAFIASLSPTTRRFRLLGQIVRPSLDLIIHPSDVDYRHETAFAAIESHDPDGPFIGISRYRTTHDGTSCECAVTVCERWQHRGLGTLLMRHLIEVAKAHGILSMYSIDRADNHDMEELAHYLGFTRRSDRDDPTMVVHSLWLGG